MERGVVQPPSINPLINNTFAKNHTPLIGGVFYIEYKTHRQFGIMKGGWFMKGGRFNSGLFVFIHATWRCAIFLSVVGFVYYLHKIITIFTTAASLYCKLQ